MKIAKRNNYYPFGLKHKGYNSVVNSSNLAQKYKYNGKELNEELGLDWYDFGARNYDATLGRWMNLDPLGELMMSHSPFNYGFNNPVYYVDYFGLNPSSHGEWAGYYEDEDGNIIFDPNANGQDDVPSGATWIGDTYYDPNTGIFWDNEGNPHQYEQLDEVTVTGSSKKRKGRRKKGGVKGWGAGFESDDISGTERRGVGNLDMLDLFKNSWIQFIEHLLGKKQEREKKEKNKSTMENKLAEEEKVVPKNIKVVIEEYHTSYDGKDGFGNHYEKIDSISTDTVNIKTTNVRKSLDSVDRANKLRRRSFKTKPKY